MVDIAQQTLSTVTGGFKFGAISYLLIIGFFSLVLLVLIGWFVIARLKYKHKFIERQLSGDRKLIKENYAREYKDKQGIYYWKLWKGRKLVPVPPSDAIEVSIKGKYFVEAYKTPGGEYHYLVDNYNFDPNDPKLQPVTTNQRVHLAKEIENDMARQKKSWTDMLMPLAGGAMMLIVFILIIAYYGKVTEPIQETQRLQAEQFKTMVEYQDKMNIFVDKLDNLFNQRQELKSEEEQGVIDITPPS